MAKKQQDLSNIFLKTETAAQPTADYSDLEQGNIHATGVGLRAGEIAALDQLAGSLGVARNKLMRFAIRYFLVQQRQGKVNPAEYLEEPPPPKKDLRLPGQD